jgi:glutathione S-transferase
MARQETQAISDFLGEKPYLMGEQPTTVDASVYSWLTHAMRVPFPGPIRDFGNSLPNLVAYCDRMHDRYYPDIEPFRP